MTYRIKLEKSQVSRFVEGRTQGYRVQLKVIETENIDPEVFVFKRDSNSTEEVYSFANVASPADMEEYPTEATAAPGVSFFRRDTVALDFRNIQLLKDAVTGGKQDLSGRLCSLKLNDELADEEITDIEA